MNRVEGKAALITGGGAGIGAATGELVCAEGGMAVLVVPTRRRWRSR
jgi:NAD(P)-dependent dehydrogenase (short-subunit alcohol dehydrogenase family)